MKKWWKKGLSLLLTLCMVLGLCNVPGGIFASTSKAQQDVGETGGDIPPVVVEEADYTVTIPVNETGIRIFDGKLLKEDETEFVENESEIINGPFENFASYTVKYVKKETGDTGSAITEEQLNSLTEGESIDCLIGYGTNYISSTCEITEAITAAKWRITKHSNQYEIQLLNSDGQLSGNYIQQTANQAITLGTAQTTWNFSSTKGFWCTAGGFDINIGYQEGYGWFLGYLDQKLPLALPYAANPIEIWETEITFSAGSNPGTSNLFTIENKKFAVVITAPCEHTSDGEYTCQGQLCEVCHEYFKKVNLSNVDANRHTGPFEITGFVQATDMTEGYTGDTVCQGCQEISEHGKIIPAGSKTREVMEYSTDTFFVESETQLTVNNPVDTDVVKNVSVEWYSGKESDPMEAVTSYDDLVEGKKFVIKESGAYLACDDEGNLFVVTDAKKAALWSATVTEPTSPGESYQIALECNGKYLGISDADISILSMHKEVVKEWALDENGKLVKKNTSNSIVLNTPPAISPATTAQLYTPDNSEPSGMNVTITAGHNGTTTFELGGVTYTVIVKAQETEGKTYRVYRYITNLYVQDKTVQGEDINGTVSYTEIKADQTVSVADESGNILYTDAMNSEMGCKLVDLLPEDSTLKTVFGNPVEFWKGTYHPEGHHQYSKEASTESSGNAWDEDFWKWKDGGGEENTQRAGALDKTSEDARYTDRDGNPIEFGVKDFQYIRFWGNRWQVSNDRENWWTKTAGAKVDDGTQRDGDQIVARYMQPTDVTKEVQTLVRDWGDVTTMPTEDYAFLDFAVKYEAGTVVPSPDSYLFKGKTIIYGTAISGTSGQTKVYMQNGVKYRWVDTIIGKDTPEREVYMITLTPSNDDKTGTGLEGTKYTYNYEEEQIVWLSNSNQPHTNMKIHPDFMWGELPDSGTVTDEMMGDILPDEMSWSDFKDSTDGVPLVSHVDIQNERGMLVTYYIRATEANLNVHYYIWDKTMPDPEQFYQLGIISKVLDYQTGECEVFSPDFAMDMTNREYNLKGNKVTSNTGKEIAVTAVLQDLPALSYKYKTGKYTLYMTRRDEDGKNVHLYYAPTELQRYVVADFGLPLKIDWELLRGNLPDDVKFHSMCLADGEELQKTYGTLVVDDSGEFITYTPTKVFTGMETPIQLKVALDVPDELKEPKPDVPSGSRPTLPSDPENPYEDYDYTVNILPATTVYYEAVPKFVEYIGEKGWSTDPTIVPDTEYQITCPVQKEEYQYGYDPYYAESGTDCTMTAEDGGSTVQFNFTGTGVELYANCTPTSGRMMVILFKNEETDTSPTVERVFSVDTHVEGSMGDNSGTDYQTWEQTRNTPVVALNDLEYGDYSLRVGYFRKTSDDSVRTPIVLDGFRVTNPLGEATIPQIVYSQNKELNSQFVEVRDRVLGTLALGFPDDWEKNSEYVDQKKDAWSQVMAQTPPEGSFTSAIVLNPDSSVTGDTTVQLDILENGPKNEYYLTEGKSLILSVVDGFDYQLGMKAITGEVSVSNKMEKEVTNPENPTPQPTTPDEKSIAVKSVTDMYYRVETISADDPKNPDRRLIVITNNSKEPNSKTEPHEHVLSITKLKAVPKNQALAEQPEEPQPVFAAFTEASFARALMCFANLPEEVQPEVPEIPEETKPADVPEQGKEPAKPEPTAPEPAPVPEPAPTPEESDEPEVPEADVSKTQKPAKTPENNHIPEDVVVDDIKDVADNRPAEEVVKPAPDVPGQIEAAPDVPAGEMVHPQRKLDISPWLVGMFGMALVSLTAVTGLTFWKRRKR